MQKIDSKGAYLAFTIFPSSLDSEWPPFTLVDSEGNEIDGEEQGLLLYKWGTVCDDSFNATAADAICKYMGYSAATDWTVGYTFCGRPTAGTS